MRFLTLPTSGWARNTTRTTLHHHSELWLCSSHTPRAGISLPELLQDPPRLRRPRLHRPRLRRPRLRRCRRHPAFSFQPSALRYFWSRNQMTHFVDPKNYFGPGCVRLLGCSGLPVLPGRLQVGAQGMLRPQLQIQLDPKAWRLPGMLCNPTVHVSARSLPFPPSGRVCCAEEASKEPRQTDRKPSLSPRGHIVCPGLNLNIKRPYLFLLFINPVL